MWRKGREIKCFLMQDSSDIPQGLIRRCRLLGRPIRVGSNSSMENLIHSTNGLMNTNSFTRYQIGVNHTYMKINMVG